MEQDFKQTQTSIIKIAMYGPESTGKTTLSKQLAAHYNDEWVHEFARNFLQEKWDKNKEICTEEDLISIAKGQVKIENEAVLKAKKILFCDTNILVTKVFSDIYFNRCEKNIIQAAKEHQYDLIFLTNIDVPWKADDLRDGPQNRENIFEIFKNEIIANGNPYIILEGDVISRFEKAVQIIDELVLAKQMGFSSEDFVTIYNKNISIPIIEKQLHFFKDGISKTKLMRSATKNDGICVFSDEEINQYVEFFDENKQHFDIQKFVPASGAASRMFKFLSEFINNFDVENDTINSYINYNKCSELSVFLVGLKSFPFYKDLKLKTIEIYPNYYEKELDERNYLLIKTLLSKEHFDFTNKPKGIMPFHQKKDTIVSPIEEHINESIFYKIPNKKTKIHFTISPEHQVAFEEITNRHPEVEVTFSFQLETTNTLAVNSDNTPFRNGNGELVFRPGGHGALINNLNQLVSDVIFIKNIDNVSQNHLLDIVKYKKLLGGVLFKFQIQIFSFLKELESESVSNEKINEIKKIAQNQLHIIVPNDFEMYKKSFQIHFLFNQLNRPIRVCGMVKNEGEPGGGPFWIKDESEKISLQIIETSQIDLSNEKQVQIVNEATHFNPVDLVCATKDYHGNKFDLTQFVDHASGFIVQKNNKGKELKGYELPGLWNGAMAKWITVFVEVPLVTFNPVKTVNDLLKPAHQPQYEN